MQASDALLYDKAAKIYRALLEDADLQNTEILISIKTEAVHLYSRGITDLSKEDCEKCKPLLQEFITLLNDICKSDAVATCDHAIKQAQKISGR